MRLEHILLILSLISARDFTTPFPSCLQGETTWDQSNVFDIVFNSTSAEECQATCAGREACVSFTWLSQESALFPLTCSLFSRTGAELVCENCVSGPAECLCSTQGECVSQGDNVIEAVPQTPSLRECKLLCDANSECNAYTYYGEENMLRNLCLLYSSCDTLGEDCVDCTTGSKDCQVCSFEDTFDGQCETCDGGWQKFEHKCYKLMEDFWDIYRCTEACEQEGGQLGSIHSQEENEFIFSLWTPTNREHYIWIGAKHTDGLDYGWTDGSAWDFASWDTNEPRGYTCVYMNNRWEKTSNWTSGECNGSPLYDCICKK